jgi:hypothetical protein
MIDEPEPCRDMSSEERRGAEKYPRIARSTLLVRVAAGMLGVCLSGSPSKHGTSLPTRTYRPKRLAMSTLGLSISCWRC